MKPLIGISCNYDYRDTVGLPTGVGIVGQDWNFVAGDYVYAIEKAGGIPLLIPQCKDYDITKELLDKLDGVILSGGHDMDPNLYGARPQKYCYAVMPQRDEQDLLIANYMTFERNKPVLGICRGLQVMNVAYGGTLYQDLEIEGDFKGHSGGNFPRNVGWHPIKISENSILRGILGQEETMVNSYHHQAALKPGKDVEITAYSCDGVPEALELKGHKFALGVQWHPEMMFDTDAQQKIFTAFIDACSEN